MREDFLVQFLGQELQEPATQQVLGGEAEELGVGAVYEGEGGVRQVAADEIVLVLHQVPVVALGGLQTTQPGAVQRSWHRVMEGLQLQKHRPAGLVFHQAEVGLGGELCAVAQTQFEA